MIYKNLGGTVHQYQPPEIPIPAAVTAEVAAAAAAKPDAVRTSRQAAWDREHIVTASCRLSAAEDQRFRDMCQHLRVSRYQLIRFLIHEALEYHEKRWPS